jgi:hypothetical protein
LLHHHKPGTCRAQKFDERHGKKIKVKVKVEVKVEVRETSPTST